MGTYWLRHGLAWQNALCTQVHTNIWDYLHSYNWLDWCLHSFHTSAITSNVSIIKKDAVSCLGRSSDLLLQEQMFQLLWHSARQQNQWNVPFMGWRRQEILILFSNCNIKCLACYIVLWVPAWFSTRAKPCTERCKKANTDTWMRQECVWLIMLIRVCS